MPNFRRMLEIIRTLFETVHSRRRTSPSGERFRAVVDSSPTKIQIQDAAGRLVFINASAEELLGVRGESATGRMVTDLYPSDLSETIRDQDREIMETGQSLEIEEEFVSGNETKTYLTIKFPITDDSGAISAIGSIGTDITERKRAEAELRRSKDTAEAANRAKSEFLANMSHELRTPLNAIIGFSAMIAEHMKDAGGDPRIREYGELINTSGYHLLDLINDVLDISKIEAGGHDLFETTVDVADIVAGCVDIVKERAANAKVALTAETESALAEYLGDERKLKQILLNLLSNAIKFAAPDGTVTVRAGRADDGDLRIIVEDNGVGIAAEDIPKAMARFSQVDATLRSGHEGTGLGLPLAQAFAELHGGSIELESEFGVGTTVTVRLPADRFERARLSGRSAA